MSDTIDRACEIVVGDPDNPLPRHPPGWTSGYTAPPVPVVDPARVVEEVVTRRLVVVDSQDRERVVIAENRDTDEMRIEVVSSDGEASFTIMVGIEPSMNDPYALIVADGPHHNVTIHAGGRDCSIALEKMGLDIPNATLTNEALEFKTIH